MLRLYGLLQKVDPVSAVSAVSAVCIIGSVFQIEPLLIASFYLGGIATSATSILVENNQ